MASTLIVSQDLDKAREKASELLASADGERSFIWVPPLEGDSGERPTLEGFEPQKESVILGSRLAQQCCWAEAVVAESLDQWAINLHIRYPGDFEKIDSERVSLLAAVDSAMADLVLITRPPKEHSGSPSPSQLLAFTIEGLREKVDQYLEVL